VELWQLCKFFNVVLKVCNEFIKKNIYDAYELFDIFCPCICSL
jgi:hypothetical protein